MANVTSSNLIPLCILRILEEYSAPETPVTQEGIGALLIQNYGISCERKALGRTLSRMRDELGLDIPTSGKGCWLNSRLFDDEELQILVDMLLSSSSIGEEKKNSLFGKLCSLSSINFRYQMEQRRREQLKKQAKLRFWQRAESDEPSEMMGKIYEAIATKRMISFNSSLDGNRHLSVCRIVSPQSLVVRDKSCTLSALDESGTHLEEFQLPDLSNVRVVDIPARAFTGDSALQSDAS